MSTEDRRRAGRLMKDARTQAIDLLNHSELTARQRAMRSVVFIEEAARLSPKQYSNAEARRVVGGVVARLAQFGAML